jgi:membrane-associated protein
MNIISILIDFILHIDQHLQFIVSQYGIWIYVILFVLIFCETGLVITPFLPGDSLLFAAGGIAAVGEMNIHLMVVLLLTAAIIGDAVNFSIGKKFGGYLFANPQSRIFKQIYLHKTQEFYARHGGKTIVIARFVPIIRTFAPFVAGMSHMHYGHFLRYNCIGAILWVLLFSYAGYFFGNLPFIKQNLSLALIIIIVISVLPAIIEIMRHKLTAHKRN